MFKCLKFRQKGTSGRGIGKLKGMYHFSEIYDNEKNNSNSVWEKIYPVE